MTPKSLLRLPAATSHARRARDRHASSASSHDATRRIRQGRRACCCAPARSTTSSSRSARGASDDDDRDHPHRAALSVRGRELVAASIDAVRAGCEDCRLGAGRAGQHGRGARSSTPRLRRLVAGERSVRVRRARREREPGDRARTRRTPSSSEQILDEAFALDQVMHEVEPPWLISVVPQLGESISEAVIAQVAEEGRRDASPPDEPVVELETDKVTRAAAVAGGRRARRAALRRGRDRQGRRRDRPDRRGRRGEGGAAAAPPRRRAAAKPPRRRHAPTRRAAGPAPAPRPTAPAREQTRAAGDRRRRRASAVARSRGTPADGAGARRRRRCPASRRRSATTVARDGAVCRRRAHGRAGRAPSGPPAQAPARARSRRRDERSCRCRRCASASPSGSSQAQHTAAIADDVQRGRHDRGHGAARALQGRFEKTHGVKLGFMSFFVKACVAALQGCSRASTPRCAAADIVYKKHYDFGIAVGRRQGPRRAGAARLRRARRSPRSRRASRALAGKRARTTSSRSTTCRAAPSRITNGGIYGSMMSTPLLNYPADRHPRHAQHRQARRSSSATRSRCGR